MSNGEEVDGEVLDILVHLKAKMLAECQSPQHL